MKSIFGLPQNIVALLAYIVPIFSGMLIYIFEKDNKFVRFHALQSTIFFGVVVMIFIVADFIPILGLFIISFTRIVAVIMSFYMMYMAYIGKEERIPVIGDVVWDQVNKI